MEILDNIDKKVNVSFSINRKIEWSEKSKEYFNKIKKTETQVKEVRLEEESQESIIKRCEIEPRGSMISIDS